MALGHALLLVLSDRFPIPPNQELQVSILRSWGKEGKGVIEAQMKRS
jgi:hypothetical protein